MCRQTAQRYDDILQQERTTRDARVAALEAQAKDAAAAAAKEVAAIRAEASRLASEAAAAAEARGRALETERLQLLTKHRERLKAIEEALDACRSDADAQVCALEVELFETYAAADVEVARLRSERDAAVSAAGARRRQAEDVAEEYCRASAGQARELAAQSRVVLAGEERRRTEAAAEASEARDAWLAHCEASSTTAMQQVAVRIVELLEEGRSTRAGLCAYRSRVEAALEAEAEASRSALRGAIEEACQDLWHERSRCQNAGAFASATMAGAVADCEQQSRRRKEALSRSAAEIDAQVRRLGKVAERARPAYIQGLVELARHLREGRYRTAPPPLPVAARRRTPLTWVRPL